MVTEDPEKAMADVKRGLAVVLIVPPTAPPVAFPKRRPGRLALLVGEPTDPRVRRAAAEMEGELFGSSR